VPGRDQQHAIERVDVNNARDVIHDHDHDTAGDDELVHDELGWERLLDQRAGGLGPRWRSGRDDTDAD